VRVHLRNTHVAACLASLAFVACATASQQSTTSPTPATASQTPRTPAELARADGGKPKYTAEDVRFMQGMIGHHAQAVIMAGWAPSHGARADVRGLAERIVVAQNDEIALMQRWLRDRGEQVPEAMTHHDHPGMIMPGTLMPGMLTPEELAELDRTRGPEFDRLFLTYMIKHHQGALTMVDHLFSSNGAAQDTDIYRFASDVHVDQVTEIDRMRLMLGQNADRSKN
jgi:uncharacterized protein (DUF305 family)